MSKVKPPTIKIDIEAVLPRLIEMKKSMDLTAERMSDPRAGDRFSEFYSFWVHVVYVGADRVIVEHYQAPCELIRDRILVKYNSHEAFRNAYQYRSGAHFSVRYVDSSAPYTHITEEDIMLPSDLEELQDSPDFAEQAD